MAKVYRYTVKVDDRGVECDTTMHWQTDVNPAGSEPSPDTVLDLLDQHFSSSGTNMSKWLALIQNGAKLRETRLYEEVEPGSSDPPTGSVNLYNLSGTQGALSSDAPPVELCAFIAFVTAKLGRSFRGGTHSPPISSVTALGSTGLFDSAWAGYVNYTNIRDLMIDQFDDGGAFATQFKPVIYSRVRRARGESFTEQITSGIVRNNLRWLRRRTTAP
jgi:hypothetical protein